MKRVAARLGTQVALPRFLLFLLVFVTVATLLWPVVTRPEALPIGLYPGEPLFRFNAGALLIGFDAGALLFLVSAAPLLRRHQAEDLRRHAAENDANRPMLLAITFATMLVILSAVAVALRGDVGAQVKLLVVVTLVLAWLFSNSIYALHYAHLYYRSGSDGGLAFTGDAVPDYGDFVYFAFTLGMTFQTSDVEVTSRTMRRTVVLHCLVAFLFNLGVIAFTINVLGSTG